MENQNNQNTEHTFSYMMVPELNQATLYDKLFTLKFEDQGKQIKKIELKSRQGTIKTVYKSAIDQQGDVFKFTPEANISALNLHDLEAFRMEFEPQPFPAIIDCNLQYGTCNFTREHLPEGALDLALQDQQNATALDKIAHEQKKSYIVENIENRRKLLALTQQSQELKQLQDTHQALATQYQLMTLSKEQQQIQLAKHQESIASLRSEIAQLKKENQDLTIIDEQKTAKLTEKQTQLEQVLHEFDTFKQAIDEINAKYDWDPKNNGLRAKMRDFFGMIMNQLYTKWYGEEVMKLSAIQSKTQDYAIALEKLHEEKKVFLAQKVEMAKQFDQFLKAFELKEQGWGEWILSFFWSAPVETDITKLMERAKNAIGLHQKNLEVNRQLSHEISQKNAEIEAITDKLTEAENEKIKALLDNIHLKDKQVKAELEAKSSKRDLAFTTEYFKQMTAYKEELLKDESLKLKNALDKISSLEGEIKVLTGNEKLQLDAYFKAQFEDFKKNLEASHALNEDLKNAFDKIRLQNDHNQALIAELTEKVKKYEAQNPKFREFIEALQEEIEGKDQAHEKLKTEHEAKIKDYQQLQEDQYKRQREYDEYKKESDEKYKNVNDEKLSVEEKLSQTEANLLACRNEKDLFFGEKQALQSQLEAVNSQVNNLTQQVTSLAADKANLNSSIALLQAEVEDLKKKYLVKKLLDQYNSIAQKNVNHPDTPGNRAYGAVKRNAASSILDLTQKISQHGYNMALSDDDGYPIKIRLDRLVLILSGYDLCRDVPGYCDQFSVNDTNVRWIR